MADIPAPAVRALADQPGALDLITESIRTLTEELLPHAGGEQRLALLMVTSALGMASRELALQPSADTLYSTLYQAIAPEGAAALVAAIRAGQHDASPALHATLLQASALRVMIAKPKLLAESELATIQAFIAPSSE